MWQIPAQFECLMRALRNDLGSSVRRSVCIGTWSGWTDLLISAYMSKLNPEAQACAAASPRRRAAAPPRRRAAAPPRLLTS